MAAPRKVPQRVLTEITRGLKGGGPRQPRLSTLVQHFFDLAGGERAVAKMLFDAMSRQDTSANVRSRILDLVLRATEITGRQLGAAHDLAGLTDEDLEHEIHKLVGEIGEDSGAEAEGEARPTGEPA